MMDYIVLAIPVFFLLIGIELLAAWIQKRRYYRLADSIADLSCGILDQLTGVFFKTVLFGSYVAVHQHARLVEIPTSSLAAWVVCFLGVDFFYYWFHRMSHEVGAIWAAHVVHHSSEEYNLTVALRQSTFQGLFSWVFYLPLALFGFPPLMFLTLSSFNTLYQFWIHTRAIGRLGPLEGFLNTPSNHRVHHGRNPKYIDRNHGGTLIIWDRLFGTYVPEAEEPVYGITTPLGTWSPLWANLHYWVELYGKARRTTRWADRVRLFVKPPGWQPEELGGFQHPPEVDPATYRKFDTPAPWGLSAYVFVQFVLVLPVTSALLFRQDDLPRATLLAGTLAVAVCVVSLTALFERRRWALALELGRVLALAAAAVWLGAGGAGRLAPGTWLAAALAGLDSPSALVPLAVGALAVAAALAAWLLQYRALFTTPPAPLGHPAA